jgi:hypothetical protein
VPLLWRTEARRVLLFCLIAFAVGWIQMAITKNAGLGAHHVTLLWPLPQWFLAVALVEAAAWRPLEWRNAGAILLASTVLFLAVENLLLTNEYFYQLSEYGPSKSWTDAIFQLSDEAGRIQAEHLVVDDWGILNPLIVLHRNRLPLFLANQSFFAPGIGEDDRNWCLARLKKDVWIGHTPEFQQWPDTNQRIVEIARAAGFEKRMIETVPDRNGRPVFEIFRFIRASPASASPASN